MTAAWIDLWEALRLVAASGGVVVERYQPGDRERLLPFGEKLDALLQSGEVKAAGLNRKQERCEIEPDEWSRVTICWSDSMIGYGSQRHRFSPVEGKFLTSEFGHKVDWLPPIDPGSRHPGMIDDHGRMMLSQPSPDGSLFNMIRVERQALELAIAKTRLSGEDIRRTGLAGRPTKSIDLILPEAKRRVDAREAVPESKAAFARELIDWLPDTAAKPKAKALTNNSDFTRIFNNRPK